MTGDLVIHVRLEDTADEIGAKTEIGSVTPPASLVLEPAVDRGDIGVNTIAVLEHEMTHDRPCRRDVVLVEDVKQRDPAVATGLDSVHWGVGNVVESPAEFGVDRDNERAHYEITLFIGLW